MLEVKKEEVRENTNGEVRGGHQGEGIETSCGEEGNLSEINAKSPIKDNPT